MTTPTLYDGDVTFQSSFNKVGFVGDTSIVTSGFKPPKGQKFVVLLLGTVDKGARDCDPVAMLNALGFVSAQTPKDQP